MYHKDKDILCKYQTIRKEKRDFRGNSHPRVCKTDENLAESKGRRTAEHAGGTVRTLQLLPLQTWRIPDDSGDSRKDNKDCLRTGDRYSTRL